MPKIRRDCKDCPDRHEGCWGSCDIYKDFKKRKQKANEARSNYLKFTYNGGYGYTTMKGKDKYE